MTAKFGPALRVSIVSAQLLRTSHLCDVVWQLENQGSEQVEIEESWLPHGQFRAAREAFVPPLILPVGDAVLHHREVEVVVVPGGLVENAFLILRALYTGDAWRIFVRMNIEAAPDGSVRPIVEAITAGPIQADA
jgi:hypothetical protein